MRRLAPFVSLLCGLGLPLGAAQFSMPLVDLTPNQISQPAMMAIWSSTDAYVTPNTQVDVLFPPDYAIPAFDPDSCNCVFMRYTSTSAGAWADHEVTVTAGTNWGVSSGRVTIAVPAALYPGKFYIRFDTLTGLTNPPGVGMETLALTDPDGNSTVSRSFYLGPTYTAAISLGSISGTVKDSTGKALPGAMVMASSYGSFLPVSLSARRNWIDPLGSSANVYSTAATSDGSYSMSLPPGSYTIKAEVWRHKNGLAYSSSIGPYTVAVSAGGISPQSFSLTPLP